MRWRTPPLCIIIPLRWCSPLPLAKYSNELVNPRPPLNKYYTEVVYTPPLHKCCTEVVYTPSLDKYSTEVVPPPPSS